MFMKEVESVSVYISQPVPCRYSICHFFMSGLEEPALIANRLDIMLLNPGARQDWAMKPSLNSAWKIIERLVIVGCESSPISPNVRSSVSALVRALDKCKIRLNKAN